MAQGKVTPIEAGIIARVTGQDPSRDWFGPFKPLDPIAPPEVKGRALDFQVGWNLNYRPRAEQGENAVDFVTLRRVADPSQGGLDLLRLALETRKDQMAAQKWTIKGRDGKDGGQRAKDAIKRLRRPDGVTPFRPWMRSILEDHMGLDAVAIYPRPTGSGVPVFEVMDGAMIKRLLDQTGRVPLPPDPAYQQVLKGVAAADFTTDELIYSMFNPRPNRVYGLGRVEQVVGIINLALRRQVSQTQFYTEGNVPEALVGVPEGWNPDQVEAFQQWWDSTMEGNTGARRHMKFIPGGMTPHWTRDPKLKDEMDEWLARVICFCFSLSPQALVKEMNRATAQTSNNQAMLEGLEPMKLWFKDLMDEILERMGLEELEWGWADEEIIDPEVKMKVWTGYKQAGIVTADEVRTKQLAYEAMTDEQKAEVAPKPAFGLEAPGGDKVPVKPGTSQGADKGGDSASRPSLPPASADEPAKKVDALQKKKSVKPLARGRAAVKRTEKRVLAAAKAYLVKVRKVVVAGILAETGKVAKADHNSIIQILSTVPKAERDKLLKKLTEELGAMAEDGADSAVRQVALVIEPDQETELEAMLSQANEEAVAWASERAAELVTQIDETTRGQLTDLVEKAMEEGWSNDELASQIEDGETFSESRAEMIARTETAFADVQGNLAGWKQTGVVESVEWIMAQDEVCEDCQSLDGKTTPLGGFFVAESGESTDGPPLHPNCFLPGTLVSAAGVTKQTERWFEGEIVRVFIEGQDPLAVTPNHPILTSRGWVPAGELQETDHLFRVADPGALVRACDPQDHHMQTRIEEVADALLVAGGVPAVSVPVAAEHFHGDGIPGQEVRIVRANGGLDLATDPLGMEEAVQPRLVFTDADLERLACGSDSCTMFRALGLPTDGILGLSGAGLSGTLASPDSLHAHGLTSGSDGEPCLVPSLAECAAVASERVGQIHAAFSGLVSPVKIEKLVRGEKWSGHVYNLETKGGWYVAGSIITHNCRCDLLPVLSNPSEEE